MKRCENCGKEMIEPWYLCDECFLKTKCPTPTDKNIFLGGNFYKETKEPDNVVGSVDV